jgi:tRNA pseudouridine38-40 synthase
MNKIALGLEYEGTDYYGWQSQTQLMTVQSCVESALSKVENAPISIACAGRTDAGVHAFGQVVHFYSQACRTMDNWIRGGNANLPKNISIRWAKSVSETFHARFSAISRRYSYVIYNHSVRSSLFGKASTEWHTSLDEQKMQIAANYLLGKHDFTSFRGTNCQAKTAIRTLYKININRYADFVVIDVKANAFLHHMVRNIVGVLIKVGEGKEAPQWAREVLLARDRKQGGITAPPTGLYLMAVEYPEVFDIPNKSLLEGLLRYW